MRIFRSDTSAPPTLICLTTWPREVQVAALAATAAALLYAVAVVAPIGSPSSPTSSPADLQRAVVAVGPTHRAAYRASGVPSRWP